MQRKAGWSNVLMLWQTLVLGNKMTPVRKFHFQKDNYDFVYSFVHSRLSPLPSLLQNFEHIMILLILQTITFYNNQRCSVCLKWNVIKVCFLLVGFLLQRGRSEGWEDQNLCKKSNDYFLILYLLSCNSSCK